MRKMMAALAVAGPLLLGIGAASPALAQAAPVTLLCSPSTNGGTLVSGVCVLPAATAGQPYEGFLLTGNGAVDTFTITAGSLPPGLSMPATYGAAGTIVGGTPTTQGTFTFTVHVVPFANPSASSANGTYSIKVGPPPPLAVSFPSSCCSAGKVGTAYLQNFFSSGGTGPFAWSVASGALPPCLVLSSPSAPQVTGNELNGTPTRAGTFKFTIKVTDSAGNQATEPASITIRR
jgi:large repetitive protein